MTQLILLCGMGGVGKTTCSVGMSIHLAMQGKNVCLLTIDPARRLADALHLPIEGNTIISVPLTDAKGSLDAMMLDASEVFTLFAQEFASFKEYEHLQQNRYFHFAASKMGGIQEMMAVLQLVQLCKMQKYDCIVVDTPPAQNAIAFLQAPKHIQRLFSNNALKWLTTPKEGFSALSFGKNILSKGLTLFLGGDTIQEIGAFFKQFHNVGVALEQAATDCENRLQDPSTQCWMVSTPDRNLQNLNDLMQQIQQWKLSCKGILINRSSPLILHPSDCATQGVLKDIEELLQASLHPSVLKHSEQTYPIPLASLNDIAALKKWSDAFRICFID